jgi:hypothetical protein
MFDEEITKPKPTTSRNLLCVLVGLPTNIFNVAVITVGNTVLGLRDYIAIGNSMIGP